MQRLSCSRIAATLTRLPAHAQARVAGLDVEMQANQELADELNMDEADWERLRQDINSEDSAEPRCGGLRCSGGGGATRPQMSSWSSMAIA